MYMYTYAYAYIHIARERDTEADSLAAFTSPWILAVISDSGGRLDGIFWAPLGGRMC